MPPKEAKDAAGADSIISGFSGKETKWLAAAFVSSAGIDKYNYELFAELTGNTAGTLKRLFPAIKRKAADAHPSFAAFLNSSEGVAQKSDAKKRKASAAEPDEAGTDEDVNAADSDADNIDDKAVKKAPAKGRAKKAKSNDDTAAADAPEDVVEKKPVPKGRAKKAKLGEDDAANAYKDSDDKKPASKGRTKKATADGDDASIKKGRGRPKKAQKEATPDDAANDVKIEDNFDENACEQPASEA